MLNKFKFGQFLNGNFKCLGWQLSQSGDEIIISQREYIQNKIQRVEIPVGKRESKEELNSEEKTILRGAIGKMRWICDQTRPDVSFDELELSMKVNKATVEDVKLMNKTINHN